MNDPSTGRPAAPFPLPPPSFLTPKAEKLLPKIEKAGVKAALKAGHVLSRDELLEVKVQLLPALYRWGLGGISAASAYGSYAGFMADSASRGLGMAMLSLLFFFFAIGQDPGKHGWGGRRRIDRLGLGRNRLRDRRPFRRSLKRAMNFG